jgi:hypothetical protein
VHLVVGATPGSARRLKGDVVRVHGDQEPIRAVASGSPFDDCTFEVDGNRLVLHYMSYPADAPVPTVMTLVRVP